MRAGAVPGTGLVTSSPRRFGNSPGRPRRRSARSWLPGRRTGLHPRWRCHEARDRTGAKGRRAFGKSRGGAPKGERVSQRERAPAIRYGGDAVAASRYSVCAIRRSASPFVWRPFRAVGRSKTRVRTKTHRENGSGLPDVTASFRKFPGRSACGGFRWCRRRSRRAWRRAAGGRWRIR